MNRVGVVTKASETLNSSVGMMMMMANTDDVRNDAAVGSSSLSIQEIGMINDSDDTVQQLDS
jgi:phosphoribosylaminoimidazole (AIR) synthetase